MRKRIFDNVKTLIVTIILIVITGSIASLPWWSFVVPVVLAGILTTILKWNVAAFGIGFLAGFLVWGSLTLYIDTTSNGIALQKVGMLFMMPKTLLVPGVAVIGGLVAGLALYTGNAVLAENRNNI